MYVKPNFKTKKAFKEAVLAGKAVTVFSPGPYPCPQDGKVSIEGPWFPKPHMFYGTVEVKDGKVVSVK